MKSDNTVPTFDRLMNPLLKAIRDLGGSGSIDEIYEKVAENLQLPRWVWQNFEWRVARQVTHPAGAEARENAVVGDDRIHQQRFYVSLTLLGANSPHEIGEPGSERRISSAPRPVAIVSSCLNLSLRLRRNAHAPQQVGEARVAAD